MYKKGKLIPEIDGSIFKKNGRHKRHQSPDSTKPMKGKNRVEDEEPQGSSAKAIAASCNIMDI